MAKMRNGKGSGGNRWHGAAVRRLLAVAVAGAGASGATAWAGDLNLGNGVSAEYQLTLNYSAAVRAEQQSGALINGPTSATTGLPTTINSDDGDRNFRSGRLINNRISTFGQLLLQTSNYGFEVSGDAFYDQVYHHPNNNTSAATINKAGPVSHFSDDARYFDGERARLLDAYAFFNWDFGNGMRADIRGGREVVSWGESLFFSGISSGQSPFDATKSFVPGVEVKDLVLPTNQVSLRFALNRKLALLGYYKLQYKPTELSPVGEYFSINDGVGPGAEFLYGAANPLYPVLGAYVPGMVPSFNIQRGGDRKPSDFGQWGVGLTYQVTPITSVGGYYLRYDDTNPAVVLNAGCPTLIPAIANPGALPPQLLAALAQQFGVPVPVLSQILMGGVTTCQAAGGPAGAVPVSYNIKYFDGIHMGGASFSTAVGSAQVAGEVSYRDGVDLLVNSALPTFSRGKVTQALTSALYTLGPARYWDDVAFAGEVGYVHVNGVDAVGGTTQLVNSRNSWGYEGLVTFDYKQVAPGLDLALPFTFAAIAKGTPALNGAFGSLYGEGDQRLSGGVTFTYVQKLQVGLSYNAFMGTPNVTTHPYADRDNVAFNVKYDF